MNKRDGECLSRRPPCAFGVGEIGGGAPPRLASPRETDDEPAPLPISLTSNALRARAGFIVDVKAQVQLAARARAYRGCASTRSPTTAASPPRGPPTTSSGTRPTPSPCRSATCTRPRGCGCSSRRKARGGASTCTPACCSSSWRSRCCPSRPASPGGGTKAGGLNASTLRLARCKLRARRRRRGALSRLVLAALRKRRLRRTPA